MDGGERRAQREILQKSKTATLQMSFHRIFFDLTSRGSAYAKVIERAIESKCVSDTINSKSLPKVYRDINEVENLVFSALMILVVQ
jgi:hypothetical protein